MTRSPFTVVTSNSGPDVAAARRKKSCGKDFQVPDLRVVARGVPDAVPRIAVDPYRLRAEFPNFWSAYLRLHYRRAEVVAVAFDVTYQTGCNWLEGVSRPTGDKMLVEFLRHPDRLLAHAGELGVAA